MTNNVLFPFDSSFFIVRHPMLATLDFAICMPSHVPRRTCACFFLTPWLRSHVGFGAREVKLKPFGAPRPCSVLKALFTEHQATLTGVTTNSSSFACPARRPRRRTDKLHRVGIRGYRSSGMVDAERGTPRTRVLDANKKAWIPP